MEWTQCEKEIPFRKSSYNYDIDAVAINDRIYLFGYDDDTYSDGMHVLIFQVETGSWEVILPPSREEGKNDQGFAPVGEVTYFVIPYNERVFVCVGGSDVMSGHTVHIFDTRNLQWSCALPDGDVPSGNLSGYACEHEGNLYFCGDIYRLPKKVGSYIWALDLNAMRWRKVAAGGWGNYTPRNVIPYKNRIYVLLQSVSFAEHNYEIMYFDLARKKWEKIVPIGAKPFANWDWMPFVHREHMYLFLSEMWLDKLDTITRFGKWKLNEVVVRFSFATNEWEQVWFKGVAPRDTLDLICVLENKAVFFSFHKKKTFMVDLSPSLRNMCLRAISKYQLDSTMLPTLLKKELSLYKHRANYSGKLK